MEPMTETANKKILIVDDDKYLRDMYSIKFSEHHFDVQSAENGAEALEKVSGDWRPDIYLVDIIMPMLATDNFNGVEEGGFKLIEELKRRGCREGNSLIILSNLGQKEDIEKALALGVDGYIIKASSTPSEVVVRVKEITGYHD